MGMIFFGKHDSTPDQVRGRLFRIFSGSCLSLMEHDLFGKPASTFPDHASAFRVYLPPAFDLLSLSLVGAVGATFGPPFETPTRAGRSTRSPII